MSNFKNFSKSVKKSLCVLASASSIFSILPTAMAMKPAPETNLSKKSISQLELTEFGKMLLLHEYVQECLEKSRKALQKSYNMMKLEYKDATEGYKPYFEWVLENIISKKEQEMYVNRFISDVEECKKLFKVDKMILDKTGIGNCRSGVGAIYFESIKLGLTPFMINFSCNGQAHSSIIVKDKEGRIYLFDYHDALYTVLEYKKYEPINLSGEDGIIKLNEYINGKLSLDVTQTRVVILNLNREFFLEFSNSRIVSKNKLGDISEFFLKYVKEN